MKFSIIHILLNTKIWRKKSIFNCFELSANKQLNEQTTKQTRSIQRLSARSSVMAEGLRDTPVSIEKSLQSLNDLDGTPTVITVADIKWPYGISLPVCGLLFKRLYLRPFSRHYHF